jgi:concentrative nucleoside transporter, CNT family
MRATPSAGDNISPSAASALPAPPAVNLPTPVSWRIAIVAGVLCLLAAIYFFRLVIGPRGTAALGVVCFLGIISAASHNLRLVNWRTVGWGLFLQIALALFILKLEIFGVRPGYWLFDRIAVGVERFLDFGGVGSRFVLGKLADPKEMEKVFPKNGFIIAFTVLPSIIFVSAAFSLLQYVGVVSLVVRILARAMKYILRTSGAETLAVMENVFMGQSEAPLLVRAYVPQMTRSEILTLMTAGMATLSGGMIAVYIGMGVDPVAILAAGVLSAPGSIVVSKLLLPETDRPQTLGDAQLAPAAEYVNAFEAIAAGVSIGIRVAVNVGGMLIAFLALIALLDSLIQLVAPSLSLQTILGWVFAPAAVLMGLNDSDIAPVARLLGTKLVANEFVAYVQLVGPARENLSPRAFTLATYALAGFANISSIGIQIGALGAVAPARRADFAQLGGLALFGGTLSTLIAACTAAMLMDG